ncbi:hypothetical protein MWU75_17575 [Ornithinimicrobium sp. F0845]|uniref:hypothetical protein n=1 Tax=Ornithinimicrobium sp. F0845 TaxID=2926412 RepID=UPI001FF4A4BD|nr:hypothetical protein [Ornithinimicrobium sp. F0845]MCK0113955.1 hypothetical protein [Ornithinimicrobium sp. F0845]
MQTSPQTADTRTPAPGTTAASRRTRPARFARATVAASLVVGTALTVVSILLMPDFSGGLAESLQAIAAAGSTATISALGFASSQLFMAVGLVGLAHLLRNRVPVLAVLGGTLALLGAFGHAVYGGVNVVMLLMAQDLGAIDTHVAVLERTEQGLAIPFMAAGLLGTVLGFILLGVAVWRGGLGPRWVGPAMIFWVVLEFVGSGLSEWAGYASGVLYAVVFGALALAVLRSSLAHWMTAAEADVPLSEPVPAGAAG